MNKKLMKKLKTKTVKVLYNSKEKQPKSNKLPKFVNITYGGMGSFDKKAYEKSHRLLWEQEDAYDFIEEIKKLSKT